jgi:hypothetical protein
MKVGGRTGSAGPFLVTNGELQKHISEFQIHLVLLHEVTVFLSSSVLAPGWKSVEVLTWWSLRAFTAKFLESTCHEETAHLCDWIMSFSFSGRHIFQPYVDCFKTLLVEALIG